jgi:hypothetical protein
MKWLFLVWLLTAGAGFTPVAALGQGAEVPTEDPPIHLPLGKDRMSDSGFVGGGVILYGRQNSHGFIWISQAPNRQAKPTKRIPDSDNPVGDKYRESPILKTRFIKHFRCIISRDFRPSKGTFLNNGRSLLFQEAGHLTFSKARRLLAPSCELGYPGAFVGSWNKHNEVVCFGEPENYSTHPFRKMKRISSLPSRSVECPLPGIAANPCNTSLRCPAIQKELFFKNLSFIFHDYDQLILEMRYALDRDGSISG